MTKYFTKTIILLIAILILASILRIWGLNHYPAGLNADEASLGYNAYSLLKTGRDEYGKWFPLVFKSFGDYKPGLYVYIIMPFVASLGLNAWAIRLPSALFGIGTVLLIFYLAVKITGKKEIGLISALLLAISPWHLQFSRGGWETNVATFFIALGILFFLYSWNDLKYLAFSALSLLISMYIYQSPRLIAPIIFLGLIILYRDRLLPRIKIATIRLAPVAILSIPLIFQVLSGGAEARFSGLSFFSDPGPINRIDQLRGEHSNPSGIVAQLLHNKITAYAPNFLGHYVDHFSSEFLFINGDSVIRNRVPESGEFFLVEALFLAIGFVYLVRGNFKDNKTLWLWIIVAPLASATTFQTPNALRSLTEVVPLTIVAAAGFWQILQLAKNKIYLIVVIPLIALLLFEFVHYLDSYYILYPKRYPLAWEYGFSQMVPKLEKYQPGYKKVVITDKYDQPYILVLFYEKYDPAKYQPQAVLSPRDQFDFGTVRSFDKYEFHSITTDEIKKSKGVLFIGTPDEIPSSADIIDKVDFPNGKPAFLFAKT